MARPSKYDTVIKPHIEDIRKAVEQGATVEEIAAAFNINVSTLHKYKATKKELSDAFARGREKVIIDIKAALLKKALGYEYTEQKTTAKKDKNGENIILAEKYQRHSPPSETAAAMLLRNLDKNWLDKDKTSTDLRIQEQELKAAIADANNIDLFKGVQDNAE